MNYAILLAAYGSRKPDAQAALSRIRDMVRAEYPGVPCEVAYTSQHVRKMLEEKGESAPGLRSRLEELADKGLRRVAIQSLHVIPGREFHDILSLSNELVLRDESFERIEVGFPLLAGEQDLEHVAKALLTIAERHAPQEGAVLFMGHGSRHPGSEYYDALNELLQEHNPLVFVAPIDGPEILEARDKLARLGIRKAALLPFLFGAGWHALRDLAGDRPESWESLLTEAGLECEVVLLGAAEHPELSKIWLAHLHDAIQRLQRC
ncbi:sirohydrochlorin cobaltochelatase [Paucidesulfovibrio longus]|uniref:sirohydrochlorin cobaltochelatase n=1 Tax=Paucidesulfovibrio longus TaxID=889 RepID=UPI0003B44E17|nr:sirohydrochlorin cobaltochelatase [Paucidesulfovibrio longus]